MLPIYLLVAVVAADGAYDKLKAKGLKATGGYYVVEEEAEVGKGLADIRSMDRSLNAATKANRQLDQQIEDAKKELTIRTSQNRDLRLQYDQAVNGGNGAQAGRLANAINSNVERMNELSRILGDDDTGKEVRSKFSKARDAYMTKLLAIRDALNRGKKKYEELSKDASIASLIPQANKEIEREYELGPSKAFQRYEASLAKLESKIQSDKIVLRKQSNTFLIDVVLNGKASKTMVFDTGASCISLPESVATEIGLSIDSDDEKVQVSIANGDKVIATRKLLESVRVGKFEVENVECLVMPASMRDAPMLLGGTFLNAFNYNMDPNTGELTLAKVDDGSSSGSKSKAKRPTKKSTKKLP